MAVVLAVVGWWPTSSPRGPWRLVAAETAVVLVLYALWLRAGELDPLGTEGGLDRGRTVWDIERWMHLPREQWLQQGPLANRLVLQASNLYYAGVHVPAMGLAPMSPLMMPPPVVVMAAPARIVKCAAEPRSTGSGPAARSCGARTVPPHVSPMTWNNEKMRGMLWEVLMPPRCTR